MEEGIYENFKLLPPPQHLPKGDGQINPLVSYFGRINYTSGMYKTKYIFGIKRIDRARHLYVVGKSGMGKTCLLEELIRSDIANGYGVAVIDPHGDLAKSLLHVIPEDRVDDLVYLDPGDVEYPIAFNLFSNVPAEFRQAVAHGLVEIFKKQFASTWTPRIEHLFRFATLATLEDPEGTLYGFMQLLTDASYRQRVLRYVTDDVVRRFFSVEFASFSQRYDQEAITPLTNRLGQFFADPLMRAIFSQKENKVNFDDIMNNGRILIINASKGSLGEENCALFTSFFLTKLSQTAMARARFAKEDRPEFYLYVDEFQNVATEAFTSLFSESRKYGVNITVANQYLTQLSVSLQEAIFGNVGTMIIFRVGGADAERISHELQPLVEPHDLINLGLRDCYVKMSIDGKISQPFSAKILDLEAVDQPDHAEMVFNVSRDKYAGFVAEATSEESVESEVAFEDPLPPPI